MPIFIVLFEKQPKNCQKKAPPKNDNFSHFAKHRFIKKPLCCNPPFDQKLVFLNLGFLKPKTMMLNNKHNSKSGNKKDQKRDLKEKTRQETKKENTFIENKEIAISYVHVVLFMKQKQRRKNNEKRQKQETKRKPKKKDKKEERKTRGKERQRKRNRKGGGQKRLREEERETLKINQKCPF